MPERTVDCNACRLAGSDYTSGTYTSRTYTSRTGGRVSRKTI